MTRWRFGLIPLAAVALLSGCATQIAGNPVAAPAPPAESSTEPTAPASSTEPAAAKGTSTDLLGEVTTVDPCSLAPQLGIAGAAAPVLDGFDYCLVSIDNGGGLKTEASWGHLYPKAAAADTTKVGKSFGPVKVLLDDGSGSTCMRKLLFTDQITLGIQTDVVDGTATPAQLCAISDAVADAIGATLTQPDKVKHFTYAANSLGPLDTCKTPLPAPSDEIAQILLTPPVVYPGGHMCRWGKPGVDSPHIYFQYIVGKPPAAAKDTTLENIAGRSSAVAQYKSGTRGNCDIQSAHIPFTGGGPGQIELAELTLTLPNVESAQVCAIASSIVGIAWQSLPKP